MKKIFTAFLSIIFLLVCASLSFAQNNKLTADYVDFNYLGSAPSNPSASKSRVYVDSSGVVRIRLNNGTDVAILTGSIDTDDVAEGSTNLYHTTSRVRAALSAGSGITYNSTTGEISLSGGGGGGALSALTAATGLNDINNANNSQIWRWNTLGGTTGLQLASSSTAAASNLQKLLALSSTGANANSSQTTYGLFVENQHTGTSSTNIAAYFAASGATNNYAGIFSGRVGINTTTPLGDVDLGTAITLKKLLYYGSGTTFHGGGVISGATVGFYPTAGRYAFGSISTGDGTTFAEKVSISDTALNLVGSSQNITFTGNGGLILGGGTTIGSDAKITFGNGVFSQAFTLYASGNTRHFIGLAANQTRIAAPTNAYTSIGNVSTSDGVTFSEYYRFNQNGKLDFTQGTITSDTPFINHSVTWNSGGTTFKGLYSNTTITAAASASRLFRLDVSGIEKFGVNSNGEISTPNTNGLISQIHYLKIGHFFDASVGFAGIANAEMTSLNTDYLALQAGDGSSYINCKSGTELFLRYGNSDRGRLTSSGSIWDFTGATGGFNSRTSFGAKTTNYSLLSTDSGGTFTNGEAVGSVTFSLPAAAAGLHYKFYVTTNQNFVIDAAGSDTIRLGASVTASGGNLTSNTVGDSLELIYIGSGQWGVLGKEQGTWAVN